MRKTTQINDGMWDKYLYFHNIIYIQVKIKKQQRYVRKICQKHIKTWIFVETGFDFSKNTRVFFIRNLAKGLVDR